MRALTALLDAWDGHAERAEGRAGAALALLSAAESADPRYAAVHAPFGPGPFPFAPGFRAHRRWGGLVRLLGPEKPA